MSSPEDIFDDSLEMNVEDFTPPSSMGSNSIKCDTICGRHVQPRSNKIN